MDVAARGKRGQPSVASISKEERKTPAAWYDARFFYEQFLTVFVCKLLFKSSHLSEHAFILMKLREKYIIVVHKKNDFCVLFA